MLHGPRSGRAGGLARVATALDAAGVPFIEVTHGDGLGGASVNYGFAAHSDEEYLNVVVPQIKQARVSALLLPGIGTVDHLRMALGCGVATIRPSADILVEVGKRETVGGQEDLIEEVAMDLAARRAG